MLSFFYSRLCLAVLVLRLRPSLQQFTPAPLPSAETALWRNNFVAVVGHEEDQTHSTSVLEDAVRQQYMAAGYGISILNVAGCDTGIVSNVDGYNPAPAPAPKSPSPLRALAPAAADLPAKPLLVRANCYRLNATVYFEPTNTQYLDVTEGTSSVIAEDIMNQTMSQGVAVDLFLLNVTILPSIQQVMYAGDTLLRVPEIAFLSTLWIEGPELVPIGTPELIGFLAAFPLLNLQTVAGVARNRLQFISQNATGVNLTYLTVVRPNIQTLPFPVVFKEVIANDSFVGVLRTAGLSVDSVKLLSQSVDNRTTVGSQVSALLSNNPVISNIGLPGSSSGLSTIDPTPLPPLPASKSSFSSGAIAGIVVGAVAISILFLLLGSIVWRKHSSSHQGSQDGSPLFQKILTPGPPPSAASSPSSSAAHKEETDVCHSLPVHAWSQGTWELTPSSITTCRRSDGQEFVLGQGTYGVVYKALLDSREEVAVKMLNRVDEWQLQQFKREIDLLRSLPRNPNVIQFYGACLNTECPFLVMEFMRGGDLRDALSDPKTAPLLDWDRKGQKIALEIARGLLFLHSKNIIHADLKSNNVLLSHDLERAKIADVGLSRIMHGSNASSTSGAFGTFSYAAPEQILGYKLTPKVDTFAFSVLLWEIVTKERPSRGQLYTINSPDQCPPAVTQLIEAGMNRNPAKRPSAAEICGILLSIATYDTGKPETDVVEVPRLKPFSIFDSHGKW